MSTPAELENLLFNLDSAVDETRMQAIMMAVRFPDPRVISALNNLAANDTNVELRYHARRAVHQIKERMSAGGAGAGPAGGSGQVGGLSPEAIANGLKHPQAEMRLKAAQALVNAEIPNKEKTLEQFLTSEKEPQVKAGVAAALVPMGAKALPMLTALLSESDPRVKANAIEAIENIGDADAYVHIVPYLTDVDNRVRANAAQALNRFGKTRLIKCLDKMIGSDKVAYRDSAVYALGMAKLPEAVPILERSLKDPVEQVRLKAARALEVLGKQGVKEAEAVLSRHRESGGEGEHTVEIALGDMFNRDSAGLSVQDLLFDDLPENRIIELKKITKLRVYERIDEIVNLLRKERDEHVKATAVITLGRLKAKKHISLIKPYLKDKVPRIRASAVEALGLLEDPALWIDLMPMLDDANNRVRANAIVALKKCPDVDLDQYLTQMLSHKDALHRKSALYALMELRDERYMGLFMTALDDKVEEVRKTALENIVILKSENFRAAEELFKQAVAKGLKPPEPTAIVRRGGESEQASATKTVQINKEIDKMLVKMVERGASDLHLTSEHPPRIRKDGDIQSLEGFGGKITADELKKLLWSIIPERNRKEFQDTNDTDLAYEIENLARFRVNVFRDRFGIGAVMRQLPSKIPSVEKLQLPKQVVDLCHLPKGLVLVTGPTGSGKSTTLAALVGYINNHRNDHIITIEDPIEFVHNSRKCLVNQREVFMHTDSFRKALRAALREDPDIVLVGEMRDLETTQMAVETAETGHLVFGTLHTNTAASTVDRLINQFPKEMQEHIRLMIADSLKGVIAQTLAKKIGGGRVAVWEIMIVNSAISNLIREEKAFQIPSVIQTTRHLGNISLNDSLIDWIKAGVIDPQEGYYKSVDKVGFLDACKRLKIDVQLPSEEAAADAANKGPGGKPVARAMGGGMGGMGGM